MQSVSFTRSMRSLQTDRDYATTLWFAVILLLFVGWLTWFFGAQIALVEMGTIVQTDLDGTILAEFSGDTDIEFVQRPRALIHFYDTDQNLFKTTTATILSVESQDKNTTIVTLYAKPELETLPAFQHGFGGTVGIEAAQVSPATLFMRTSSRLVSSI